MQNTETTDYVEKAIEKVRENFKKNEAKITTGWDAKLAGKGEFSIDDIEAAWGDILDENKKITEELVNDIVRQRTEKELIVKKQEIKASGGLEVENGGKQTVVMQTLHGILAIARSVLKPKKKRCTNPWCGKVRVKEVIPLDEFLRIDRLPFKMTVMAMVLCARFAQAMPYKESERMVTVHGAMGKGR